PEPFNAAAITAASAAFCNARSVRYHMLMSTARPTIPISTVRPSAVRTATTPPSSYHTPKPVARRPGATLIKRAEAQRTKLLPRKIESPKRAGVGPKAPAQTEPIFNAMKAGLPLRNGEPGPDVGAGCPRTMKFGRCHA